MSIKEDVTRKTQQYWKKRDRELDRQFNKTNKEVLNDLKKEYQRVWKDIESEINGWYARTITNPDFRFSELKSLQDTQKAVELLLDELYDIERNRLGSAMDDLYISTYQDMNKLTQDYFNSLDRAVPKMETDMFMMAQETNRVASMSGVETLIRKEIDTAMLSSKIWDKEILAKPLEWYQGFANGTFNSRIDRRRAIVKTEINQAIRTAYIQGSGVDKCTKDIMKRLDVSYSNAKRLAHNELAYAQHSADSRQMKENGFKGVKRKTLDDNHRCKICEEHEGEIIPIDEYKANPSVMMLHVNCRDYALPIMTTEKTSVMNFKEFKKKGGK